MFVQTKRSGCVCQVFCRTTKKNKPQPHLLTLLCTDSFLLLCVLRSKCYFLRVDQDKECNMECTGASRKPLCASDGRTFTSRCEYLRAKCRDPQLEVSRGPCKETSRCVAEKKYTEQQAKKQAFVPVCNPDGTYSEVQCHSYTGYCWCVTPNGRPISGSSVVNKKPRCQDVTSPYPDLWSVHLNSNRQNRSRASRDKMMYLLLSWFYVLFILRQHDLPLLLNIYQVPNSDCTAFFAKPVNCIHHAPTNSGLWWIFAGCPGAKKTEFLTSVLDALSTDMVHAVTDPASAGRMAEPDPSHTLEERVVHWYFSQLDKNGSGDIGKKEIKPFKRFLRKKSKPKKCVKKFVEYCDISNDKALSLQELMGCLGVTKEDGAKSGEDLPSSKLVSKNEWEN
uniref:SPARC related modular calcium binding 2 n=1 Tax=Xiphophorus couchianus TaxID=32473 RepID=A0A3B5L0R9_9TELE